MRQGKRTRLEAKGWKVGTAQEFLGLPEEEAAYVELKLRLATSLRELRQRRQLTQAGLGKLLKSSQSRVAKMEAGEPSVSLDLLIRSLLTLGTTSAELSRIIATAQKLRARWENTNSSPRVTLARRARGRLLERVVGPRGRLTLEEAAAVLQRPVREVRRSIRTGFLRACLDGRHVTLAACHQFLLEEREDGEAAVAIMEKVRRGEMALIPAEQVYRELGLE